MLTDMITAQRNLQNLLGNDFTAMSQEKRVQFIKDHALACTDELHEALGEVGWKPWATSKHINEDAFFGELRDAWQFLTNLMLVIEPDPEKLALRLSTALYDKIAINVARHHNAYDGVSGKCPSCRRALEEVVITEVPLTLDRKHVKYVCACGVTLPADLVAPYIRD